MDICPRSLFLKSLEDLRPTLGDWATDRMILGLDTPPWPDISIQEMSALSLARSLLKKFVPKSTVELDKIALASFFDSNERCRNHVIEPPNSLYEEILGDVKTSLYNFFEYYPDTLLPTSYDSLLDQCKLGKGLCVGSVGTDFYSKLFSSPLTYTSGSLYKAFRAYVSRLPAWNHAEELRGQVFRALDKRATSRLAFVPKNDTTSRTICIEPTVNMLFQLGLASAMTKRLRDLGLNLATQQSVNRLLAHRGSLDGSLATLDLEKASDSLSLTTVREMFPKWVTSLLLKLRSPSVSLPDGREMELHMVSTMGNGFTFPLQTILFHAVVQAVYRSMGIKPHTTGDARNLAVNGDDIIVVTETYTRVVKTLEILNFRVNTLKSFSEGHFRESCGHDYFHGRNVRGVYCQALKSSQDIASLLNRLVRWSSYHKIMLHSTCRYLLSFLRGAPEVPGWESDDAGIHVPYSMARTFPRCKRYGSTLYRVWVVRPKRLLVRDHAIVVPRGSKPRLFNEDGLLVSVLEGCLRSHTIMIRHDCARYERKLRIAPNWRVQPSNWIPSMGIYPGLVDTVDGPQRFAVGEEGAWECTALTLLTG